MNLHEFNYHQLGRREKRERRKDSTVLTLTLMQSIALVLVWKRKSVVEGFAEVLLLLFVAVSRDFC